MILINLNTGTLKRENKMIIKYKKSKDYEINGEYHILVNGVKKYTCFRDYYSFSVWYVKKYKSSKYPEFSDLYTRKEVTNYIISIEQKEEGKK